MKVSSNLYPWNIGGGKESQYVSDWESYCINDKKKEGI